MYVDFINLFETNACVIIKRYPIKEKYNYCRCGDIIVGLLVQNQKIVKIIYNIDISLLTMLLLLFVPFLSDFTIWEGSEMNLSSV